MAKNFLVSNHALRKTIEAVQAQLSLLKFARIVPGQLLVPVRGAWHEYMKLPITCIHLCTLPLQYFYQSSTPVSQSRL